MSGAPRRVVLSLPYPPSCNRLYTGASRNPHARVLRPNVRRYRRDVWAACKSALGPGFVPLSGLISAVVVAEPPDARRRDGDNLHKAIWDALRIAGVIRDDCDVKVHGMLVRDPKPPGAVHVVLEETAGVIPCPICDLAKAVLGALR